MCATRASLDDEAIFPSAILEVRPALSTRSNGNEGPIVALDAVYGMWISTSL